ncbi:LOW QUALITY PROTEIN: hypothetical protein MSG28_015993 [Choristoneura fumiferana]|uniref:Uncharacterized protein n=1 Tax=Choristoneura fumiferana TaxID=7141 RepID=A0ACC0K4X5_CHOFU|nr:LOW QUALITY PROTEIN: hypothetical protein MSG28_015993 [Choristoneura fumiferana]
MPVPEVPVIPDWVREGELARWAAAAQEAPLAALLAAGAGNHSVLREAASAGNTTRGETFSVLVGYPTGGLLPPAWSFPLLAAALLADLVFQKCCQVNFARDGHEIPLLYIDECSILEVTFDWPLTAEDADGNARGRVGRGGGGGRGRGRGDAAGPCAGAVLLTTCVMAALEPTLPPWIRERFHPQVPTDALPAAGVVMRWVTGLVFVPDSVGYVLATAWCGGAARALGAERVALSGQLAVALAALALPAAPELAVALAALALPAAPEVSAARAGRRASGAERPAGRRTGRAGTARRARGECGPRAGRRASGAERPAGRRTGRAGTARRARGECGRALGAERVALSGQLAVALAALALPAAPEVSAARAGRRASGAERPAGRRTGRAGTARRARVRHALGAERVALSGQLAVALAALALPAAPEVSAARAGRRASGAERPAGRRTGRAGTARRARGECGPRAGRRASGAERPAGRRTGRAGTARRARGECGRALGAERVALSGQLAVALAALALPAAPEVWWLCGPHLALGGGLGAVDAALVPALLARAPRRVPQRAALVQAAASAAYVLGPVLGGLLAWRAGFPTALRVLGAANLLYAGFLYRQLERYPLSPQDNIAWRSVSTPSREPLKLLRVASPFNSLVVLTLSLRRGTWVAVAVCNCPVSSGPGPGAYQLPTTVGFPSHDPSRTRAPQYSFGSVGGWRARGLGPGPAYRIDRITREGAMSSPAWSFGARYYTYTLHYAHSRRT